MNKNGIIYTVVFSFIVTFLFVFILGVSHLLTKSKVDSYRELSEKKSILTAFGYIVGDDDVVLEYNKNIKSFKINNEIYLKSENNGKTIIGKKFTGSGLWGNISGVISITSDGSEIFGFEITSHNETPGLGGRIEESWFIDQFKGEKISTGSLDMNKDSASDNGDSDKNNGSFDTITGATQTSNFLKIILNNEISQLKEAAGKINE